MRIKRIIIILYFLTLFITHLRSWLFSTHWRRWAWAFSVLCLSSLHTQRFYIHTPFAYLSLYSFFRSTNNNKKKNSPFFHHSALSFLLFFFLILSWIPIRGCICCALHTEHPLYISTHSPSSYTASEAHTALQRHLLTLSSEDTLHCCIDSDRRVSFSQQWHLHLHTDTHWERHTLRETHSHRRHRHTDTAEHWRREETAISALTAHTQELKTP